MNRYFSIIGLTLLIITSITLYSSIQSPTEKIIDYPTSSAEPKGLDEISKGLSFNETIQLLQTKGNNILLPKWLPEGLTPTKAYSSGSDTVFVYSYKGIERIASAEFTLEITYGDFPFTQTENTSYFLKVGEYDAYYNYQAWVGWSEYRKLYGDTSKLLVIHVDDINYWFKSTQDMSKDELFKIAESIF